MTLIASSTESYHNEYSSRVIISLILPLSREVVKCRMRNNRISKFLLKQYCITEGYIA